MIQIKLLVDGGAMQPGPALAQKVGPLGLNVGQIIQQVNDATKNFKGLKVPVEISVEPSTKKIEVSVSSPSVSELLKKELGLDKGSGLQKKQKIANASIEQIISIAKTKQNDLLCKDLKSSVKTIIGTCVSLGVLVENHPASEVGQLIDKGSFAEEIKKGSTETPSEKRKSLDEYFSKIKKQQEDLAKQEQAAKEAAEAAALAAKGGAATTTAPAKEGEAAAKTPATAIASASKTAVPAPELKKEEKKEGKKK
ncbi:50S ribosomal protein L11 [Candidatus Pacearchaeota archaeon]|nr:50S ribosomal protein L11 [Candidatus Pacearchaeota archaeon]